MLLFWAGYSSLEGRRLLLYACALWVMGDLCMCQIVKGYPDNGGGGGDVSMHRRCNDTSCELSKPPVLEEHEKAPRGVNDKTHEAEEDAEDRRDPYDRDGRYWLVPPFLIGACTVIVLYVFMHCFYLHCYTKKKIAKMTSNRYPPAIVISDDPTSTASYQPYTPMVKYEGAYGQTELHPFLVCHPIDDNEWERQLEQRRRSSVRSSIRKKSFSLQIPKFLGGQRASVCSAAANLEPSSSNADSLHPGEALRPARASICFVPVGRTLNDSGQVNMEMSQMQAAGYMYPMRCPAPKPQEGGTQDAAGSLPPQGHPPPMIFLGNGGELLFRRPSAQFNLAAVPNLPKGSTAPTLSVNSSPSTASGLTSCPSSSGVVLPALSKGGKTHSVGESSSLKGAGGQSKPPEVQVTFHIEDCDSGHEVEIPLDEIKEEQNGS